MACNVNTLLEDACTNGFSCIPTLRHHDIAMAQLLCEIKDALAGGITGVTGVYSGVGSPVGVVTPTGTAAVYFDTSDGTQWNYYSGAWH